MTGLAKKLAAATAAIGYIPKRGKNTQQGYDYVTDADVLDTVRSKLSEQGVATTVGVHSVDHVPFVTSKGSPMFLTTVAGDLSFLDGDSGEVLSIPFRGVGSDSTDKGYYKAVTGGVKYALLKSMLVPTGDDPERDEAHERSQPPKPVAPPKVTPAVDVKAGLTDPQKKKLFATFDDLGITDNDSRRFVLVELTGKNSTKQMTGGDLDKVLAFFAEKNDATELLTAKALAAVAGR